MAELIVALDVSSTSEVRAVLRRLPAEVGFYKVGLELYSAEGPSVVSLLRDAGKSVFLDLKLHDIPRTVERAVLAAAAHGVDLLTIHASGGRAMMAAAAKAAKSVPHGPRILAVTLLTSMDAADLADLGVQRSPPQQVESLGRLAIGAGVNGLVCSAQEVADLRHALGAEPLLVTPGIRPAGGEAADQKRVATPAAAVRGGATHLVVGRPILEAADPVGAVRQILDEMGGAGS